MADIGGGRPAELAAAAGVLAAALSSGRRRTARPVTGAAAVFATDLSVVYVPQPPPAPTGMTPLACLAAGIALQASPTKEVLAGLPLSDLDGRVRRSLQLVEGEMALGWATRTWPGLTDDLARLTGGLQPADVDLDGARLLERARSRANASRGFEVPAILGMLPGSRPLSGRPWTSAVLARARLPWSRSEVRRRSRIAVPVGGTGGEQAPRTGPPETLEPDCESSRADRRLGVPYPEWDVHHRSYLPDHVAVLEIRSASTAGGRAAGPSPDLFRWFQEAATRLRQGRLEDGTDIDVDAYVDEHCRRAGGEEGDGRIYSALRPGPRDTATAMLLDATSSLQARAGRVFALELACADALVAAMGHSGEQFAVFAFSGETRHRVEVRLLRDFGDPPGPLPSGAELRPSGYTRLGAALRHVTRRVLDVPAERRILLSLGDGLPSDEAYEGTYAEADVARAVVEAESQGVFVYHIGVGDVLRDPLPRCFGPGRAERVSSPEDLPAVLARVHAGMVDA